MQKLLKSKRGAFIVLWALLLPVLLGMTGLVIDIGAAYVDKTKIQHIADAAALAGASKIKHNDEAEALAREYVIKNNAGASSVDVTFSVKNKIKQINVDIIKYSPTYFLKIFKLDGMNVAAHAAATGFNQPVNPLDYAIISDGPADFNLLGNSGSHNTSIIGGVYSGAENFYFDNNSGSTHENQTIEGNIYTPNKDMIKYIDAQHTHNERFREQVMTEADKIILTESPDVTKFIKQNIANDKDISDIYHLSSADIANMTNIYSPGHAYYVNSSEVDFSQLGGPLFVNGNFEKSVSSTDSFSTPESIVIVATGNINITGGTTIPSGHNVILCSLNGNVTYDGSVGSDKDKKGKLRILAPNGNIKFTGGNVYMEGFLLGKHVETGQNGTLYLENHNASSGTTGEKSQIRLVE